MGKLVRRRGGFESRWGSKPFGRLEYGGTSTLWSAWCDGVDDLGTSSRRLLVAENCEISLGKVERVDDAISPVCSVRFRGVPYPPYQLRFRGVLYPPYQLGS